MRTGSTLAERLRAHLTALYGYRASSLADQVIRLLEQYAPRIRARRKLAWDEKDVILITYGDQITDGKRPTLDVLREFLLAQELAGVFQILHLLPIFPFSSDDGFAVVDYRKVDPKLGAWEHVQELGAHFDLMIDLVLNHVSRQSAYFKGYVAGEPRFAHFFIEAVPHPLLVQVIRPRSTPLLTPVDTKAGRRYVWTTFSDDQVDLNYAEPAVLLEMLDVLLFYLEQGARIIRLDAVPYLWKRVGTSCFNLPETHETVKLLRDVVDAVAPGTLLLAEADIPRDEATNYFGRGDEAHLVYRFALPAVLLDAFINNSGEFLDRLLATEAPTPMGTTVVNILATHDGVGLRGAEEFLPPERLTALVEAITRREGYVSTRLANDGSEVPDELNISYFSALADPAGESDQQLTRRRFLAAHALMMALRGIPAVYILSLFATPNYQEGVRQTGRPRTINRRKFTIGELQALLADESGDAAQVFRGLKRLVSLRAEQPAFHPEAPQIHIPTGNPRIVAFLRESFDGAQRIFVAINLGKDPEPVPRHVIAEQKVVRDLLSPWPEVSFLSKLAPPSSYGSGVEDTNPTDVIPPGGIIWWEVK